MLTQTFESENKWYSLEYPRVWEMEVIENIPSFFDPFAGKGAVQVLSVNCSGKPEPEIIQNYPFLNGKTLGDKMLIFLHSQQVNIKSAELSIVTKGNMEMIPFEYSSDGSFFMAVMMEENGILLLVLYNSTEVPDKEEASIISAIIQSIKFTQQ